jgi:hypothetical protein
MMSTVWTSKKGGHLNRHRVESVIIVFGAPKEAATQFVLKAAREKLLRKKWLRLVATVKRPGWLFGYLVGPFDKLRGVTLVETLKNFTQELQR